MKAKIGIIGGGSWGTALGILLANKNHKVKMWVRNQGQLKEMQEKSENVRYLPEVQLPKELKLSNNIEEVLSDKDIVLLATPSHSIRQILKEYGSHIKREQIIVNVAKGIENDTLMRVSQIVQEFLPDNKYVMLSGPSHAEEVARGIPTTVVSASTDRDAAQYIQDVFMTVDFRVYTNLDVVGVELAGALKNVIALAAGISDGSGYGDNTKAALMTRGIFEMARLGEKMGASPSTFSGLAGIGDLIVTCTSMLSRNRQAGILIGKGASVEESIREIGMVVEGIKTTKSTYMLAKKYDVDMPITEELYKVLYEGKDVKQSVPNLMDRDKKEEMENMVFFKGINW
ncbi:MAG TPA: NAD(P)H-dependent glycerol-3-phosphate dehydrogenase [Tissierellaceae bacterium]|nr:NAD(P)H-dependent glycerol-3-phosphate dehydrogenase [Tissierellaceae bacterium]